MPEIPDYYKHLTEKAEERAAQQGNAQQGSDAPSALESTSGSAAPPPPTRRAATPPVPPPVQTPPARTPPPSRTPPPARTPPPSQPRPPAAYAPPLQSELPATREDLDGPLRTYNADAFQMVVPQQGWTDKTIYILAGPVSDGLQHNVTVTLDPDLPAMSLADYTSLQRQSIEAELRGLHLLLEDEILLDCGLPAARLVYKWYPAEDQLVYQQQVYVLDEGMGYKLTATFTQTTRKTFGPSVDRIMRSFVPLPFQTAPRVAGDR